MRLLNRGTATYVGIFASILSFGSVSLASSDASFAAPENSASFIIERIDDLSSEDFMQSIHVSNLSEIEMGEMALDRSQDKDIQEYGRIIMRDHRLADEAIRFVANQKKISLDEAKFTDTAKLFKADSDQAMQNFNNSMTADFRGALSTSATESHQKTLDLIKRAQSEVSDRTVRTLAYLLRPIIERHLKLAKELSSKPEP